VQLSLLEKKTVQFSLPKLREQFEICVFSSSVFREVGYIQFLGLNTLLDCPHLLG